MKHIIEVWEKGKLVSREEKDDGLPDIIDIEKRLKIVEDEIEKLKTKTEN